MTQNKVIGTHKIKLLTTSNRLGREQAQSSVEKNEYLLIFHRMMTFISRWSSSPFFCPSPWPKRICGGQMDTSWKRINTLKVTDKSHTCRPSLEPVTFRMTQTRTDDLTYRASSLLKYECIFIVILPTIMELFKIILALKFTGKTKLLVSFETKP